MVRFLCEEKQANSQQGAAHDSPGPARLLVISSPVTGPLLLRNFKLPVLLVIQFVPQRKLGLQCLTSKVQLVAQGADQ